MTEILQRSETLSYLMSVCVRVILAALFTADGFREVPLSLTRRQVLSGIGGLAVVGIAAAGSARYWLGYRDSREGRRYELIAAPLDVELVSGHTTQAWAFGNSAPGTELRVRQGDWLHVRFINQLPVATTIHWHGIRLPLSMDGVPYVSQLPVLPGESFDYRFRVMDAGSYWYHPHVGSSEQLGRGLVGPLIIDERDPPGFEHERTLCLKNWHVDESGKFLPFSILREAARGGTLGRLSTVNGAPQPTIDLPAGEVVRVRLLNLDSTATYRINLRGNAEIRVYTLDGHPIEPRPLEDEYWLGPGMRMCLAIRMGVSGDCLALRDGPVRLGTLRAIASRATTTWPPRLKANPVAEPDLAKAELLRFTFEWAARLSPSMETVRAPNLWQINGKAWDIDERSCVDRPIARLKLGSSYIFELRNVTQYQHPIHLHGMTFKVLSSDKRPIVPYFTDTFLLGKNERARIALVADNPGIWMFHCHVIDHMETGLMAAIEVS